MNLKDISSRISYLKVELAFQANEDFTAIIPVDDPNTPLVVFFPTDKKTGLEFFIQGPYRTNLSRENIYEDNDFNIMLVKETAELMVEALEKLKEMNLLTVDVFRALPFDSDNFPEDSMFRVFYEKLHEALSECELLPADDKTFAYAKNALITRTPGLINLVPNEILRELFEEVEEVKWLSYSITEANPSGLLDYLTESLGIKRVYSEDFISRITPEFLSKRSDDWMKRFYLFLKRYPSLWESGDLNHKRFIRTEKGEHVTPFTDDKKPNVWIPPEEDTQTVLDTVLRRIAEDSEVEKFLINLDIPKYNIVIEVIHEVLPKYFNGPDIDFEENKIDMDKIIRAYEYDEITVSEQDELIEKLKSTSFIPCNNLLDSAVSYENHYDVYFRSDELLCYFSNNNQVKFPLVEYLEDERFVDLFETFDVWNTPWVLKSSEEMDGLEKFMERYADCEDIEFLKKSSIILWDFLPEVWHDVGTSVLGILKKFPWLPDGEGKFHKPGEIALSQLADEFEKDTTISDALGMERLSPEELEEMERLKRKDEEQKQIQADLDKREADVAKKEVHMAAIKAEMAKLAAEEEQRLEEYRKKKVDALTTLGLSLFSPEEIKHLRDNSDVFKKLIERRQKKKFNYENVSSNLDRRNIKIVEAWRKAPKDESQTKTRHIKESTESDDIKKIRLSDWYTEEGVMYCQICREEMPFKDKYDEYYFEVVLIMDNAYFERVIPERNLALCPLCAAKYKVLVKKDEVRQQVIIGALEALANLESVSAEGAKIEFSFGNEHGNDTISFHPNHLGALRVIMIEKAKSR